MWPTSKSDSILRRRQALTVSLPRELAAVLAPLMDRGALHAEGTVTAMRNAYNIPISIELFSPPAMADVTLRQLSSRFDIRARPHSGGAHRKEIRPPKPDAQYVSASTVGVGASQAYDRLLQSSIAFDPRALRDAPEKFGLSIQDLEALPLAKQPPQVKTKMLSYQLQGLAWLLNMEHPKLPAGEEVRQFWTKKGTNWFNIATKLYCTL
jgi:SWI/SNF-related matrix-associated actin-dependent regulator of chromatin subfamily A3